MNRYKVKITIEGLRDNFETVFFKNLIKKLMENIGHNITNVIIAFPKNLYSSGQGQELTCTIQGLREFVLEKHRDQIENQFRQTEKENGTIYQYQKGIQTAILETLKEFLPYIETVNISFLNDIPIETIRMQDILIETT
mgnify:CR=1 FL=1